MNVDFSEVSFDDGLGVKTQDKVLTEEQVAIIEYVRTGKGDLLIKALAGSGKCLGLGTPVLMFDGRILPVEAIKVGDLLMGPDSEPRTVLSTSTGVGPLYRVIPVKGDSWVCNDAHILTLVGTGYYEGKIRDVSVQDILIEGAKKSRRVDRDWKLWRTGVDFIGPYPNVPLDPYLAGLWLGDGTNGRPEITNSDLEIIEYCRQIAPKLGLECVTDWHEVNHTFTIRFRVGARGTYNTRTTPNIFYNSVEKLIDSNRNKIIPQAYLVGSRETRLALLAGLIDTDGFVDHGWCELTTKYDELATQILFLARSLGLAAYLHKKRATIKSIGFEGIYNRISISGDLTIIPCLVARRKAAPRKQVKRVTVTGFDLDKVADQGDYYGFTLDCDGRFLLGDFTVTHNTWTILKAIEALPPKSILLTAFNKRIQETLLARAPKLSKNHVVHIKTFHGLGLSILKSKFRHLEVNNRSTEGLINQVAHGSAFKVRRAATNLLKTYKETRCVSMPDKADIKKAGDDHSLFKDLEDKQVNQVIKVVADAYWLGKDFSKRTTIDFCDMVWGPIVADIASLNKYQMVMVDELQDLSLPQYELLMRVLAPNSRFIGVGDSFQDIYKFRESLGKNAWAMIAGRNGKTETINLPLTMTFRCDQAIVRAANELVPELRHSPTAGLGCVEDMSLDELPKTLNNLLEDFESRPDQTPHTFVLSRNNADLLSCALKLWASNPIPQFCINGAKEMFDPLFDVLDKLPTQASKLTFEISLKRWHRDETKKAEDAGETSKAERIEEQFKMLTIAVKHTAPNKIRELLLKLIGDSEPTDILLSTVHKVKGLEAENVFLLKETFARHDPQGPMKRQGPDGEEQPINDEELACEYVAITRAMHNLIWVTGSNVDIKFE